MHAHCAPASGRLVPSQRPANYIISHNDGLPTVLIRAPTAGILALGGPEHGFPCDVFFKRSSAIERERALEVAGWARFKDVRTLHTLAAIRPDISDRL